MLTWLIVTTTPTRACALLTSVHKFSPAANVWLHGEITAVKSVLGDNSVKTTYTVSHEDEDEEDLSHKEVAQKIHVCEVEVVGDNSHHEDNAQPDA